MIQIDKEVPIMDVGGSNIVLFHPHMPKAAIDGVVDTLKTRWIGQGPKVDLFEQRFSREFCSGNPALAVGSGTDALHLAFLLAGVEADDEVIAPVFTCTATNIPFLYIGAKIRFADVQQDTLNIDPKHVRSLITSKTKAIVCVHYGGLPCDMDELHQIGREHGIPVIEDAAHALGAKYKGKSIGEISDFTMFSFQAIKHITTGDGGLLTYKNSELHEKARRIRWFGINRTAKQKGVWENDITEVGYKYQMTDIAAAMGLAALDEFSWILSHRKSLLARYESRLSKVPGVKVIGAGYSDREHAAWLCTVLVEDRRNLQKKLLERNIESNQVHYRNDRYSVFGGRQASLPNMDALEEKYLVLPLHTKMNVEHVDRVCDVMQSGCGKPAVTMIFESLFNRKKAASDIPAAAAKLHFGCGSVRLPGDLNLDTDPRASADLQVDMRDAGRKFAVDSADEILLIHSISYLRLWEARRFFRDALKILKPGTGKLVLEFPDLLKCARLLAGNAPGGPEYIEAARAIYAFDLKQIRNEEAYHPYHFGWSAGHIALELREAGFANAKVLPPQTHGPRPERDTRIEAFKA